MADDMTDKNVEVTQADRDAALHLANACGIFLPDGLPLEEGHYDDDRIIQAFARHRQRHQPQERETVLDPELVQPLKSALRFAASRAAITSEEEHGVLAALTTPAPAVSTEAQKLADELEKCPESELVSFMAEHIARHQPQEREADEDEAYELGKRDGYSEALQKIDQATGGDGEYRYCLGDEWSDRHCPDEPAMFRKIVERFAALTTPAPAISTACENTHCGDSSRCFDCDGCRAFRATQAAPAISTDEIVAEELVEAVVDAANIVSYDGYYEIDKEAALKAARAILSRLRPQ